MIAQKDPLIGKIVLGAAIFAALASSTVARTQDDDDNSTFVSTGQKITPTAAPKADFQLLILDWRIFRTLSLRAR
jgi:hypothetical protein